MQHAVREGDGRRGSSSWLALVRLPANTSLRRPRATRVPESPVPTEHAALDWFVIAAYLAWITWDGMRLTKKSNELEGYLLASRSLPWWAVGLSVMATQLSAITMIGTTGQGYADGMRFLQFYFALPIAMIVLSVTLVPFFHNARVYTAYEYLERASTPRRGP